jgi:hypothetical protein
MGGNAAIENIGDDTFIDVHIGDFSRGQISEVDPADLPLNASPRCRNFKGLKGGELLQRDGWQEESTSPVSSVDADGAIYMDDENDDRHKIIWQNGNMYSGNTDPWTLIASGVYAAGRRVAAVARDGILYYSDGLTLYGVNQVGIREYNPATNTDAAIGYSAAVGRIPAPACNVLALINGSLVGGDTYVSGTEEPHAARWSDPDFPSIWLGASIHNVGKGAGGRINCIQPMSIATDSLTPVQTTLIGKTKMGIYAMTGALGEWEERIVNGVAGGVLDGRTMAFLPGPVGEQGSYGTVVFLGTDKAVYETNGTTARIISEHIRKDLADWVTDQIALDLNARFSAARHTKPFMYVLDVAGNRQYCFDYNLRSWWPMEGWPSGILIEGEDALKQKLLFCVTTQNSDGDVHLAQVDVGLDDNGTRIDAYWLTPYIKGPPGDQYTNQGDPRKTKRFRWLWLDYSTDSGTVQATLTVKNGEGQSCVVTKTNTLPAGLPARYDVDTYDGGGVYGDTLVVNYPNYSKRLTVKRTGVNGFTGALYGKNVQIKIEQTVAQRYFKLNGLTLKYQERGMRRCE